MKFRHFDAFSQIYEVLHSIHDKTMGTIISAITVSDGFFLQYLTTYLIYPTNISFFKKHPEKLSTLIKLLCYTAPDPLSSSSKSRKAAAKAGWYDRLCQAEIVLNLACILTDEVVTENKLKERIWKKMAPPTLTGVTVPSGVNIKTTDAWLNKWEEWDSVCKNSGLDKLDREKLKKIQVNIKELKEKKVKKKDMKVKIKPVKDTPKVKLKLRPVKEKDVNIKTRSSDSSPEKIKIQRQKSTSESEIPSTQSSRDPSPVKKTKEKESKKRKNENKPVKIKTKKRKQ